MDNIKILLTAIPIVIACAVAKLISKRDRLYYHPMDELVDTHLFKQVYNVEEFDISGVKTWLIPSKNKNKKLILFVHGNAGNITHRQGILSSIASNIDVNIACVDYLMLDVVNMKNIHDLFKQVIHFFIRNNYKKEDIIIWGESIGCAIGLELCDTLNLNNMVCMCGFRSMKDMSAIVLGKIPTNILFSFIDDYNNKKKLKHLFNKNKHFNCFIMHSKSDDIIPFEHVDQMCTDLNINLTEIYGMHNKPLIHSDIYKSIRYKFNLD